jgi:hypothetical protein
MKAHNARGNIPVFHEGRFNPDSKDFGYELVKAIE